MHGSNQAHKYDQTNIRTQHTEHIHISLVYTKPVEKSWNEHHINCHIDAKSKKHKNRHILWSTAVEQIKKGC